MSIYTQDSGMSRRPADPKNCAEAVHDGGRFVGFHQCSRKATLREKDERTGRVYGFCRAHAPSTQRAAARKREARWQAEADEREAGKRVARAEASVVTAALAWFTSGTNAECGAVLLDACAAVERARKKHAAAKAAVPA